MATEPTVSGGGEATFLAMLRLRRSTNPSSPPHDPTGHAMTRAQEIALANPCYLAGETIHPRYVCALVPGQAPISLKITVNAGYE